MRPVSFDRSLQLFFHYNTGRGQVNYLEYTWEKLEKKPGDYHIEVIGEAIKTVINPVLIIRPKPPSWLKTFSAEKFSTLLFQIGGYLKDKSALAGVILGTVGKTTGVWDAYIDAFKNVVLLADLHDRDMIYYLKEKGVDFGLAVSCSEGNWMDCCEAFAKLQLQSTWERAPVLLQIKDCAPGEHILRESRRWHAGFSDMAMDIGYKIILRRVTYPKKVSAGGALPIRFWFVNDGSAPCYMDFKLKIKLKKGSDEYIINLNINRMGWKLGDIIHNEIVQLPELEPGSYRIYTGIFFGDDLPMKLYIESKEEQGFYELGKLEADTQDRNELYQIWNDFYPEGYYPLEDPEAPNEAEKTNT